MLQEMHSRKARPPAKFGRSDHTSEGVVPAALLKQARRSGQLNLSGRGLKVVPTAVWRVNSEPMSDKSTGASFDTEDKWWDQTDLIKLILASNELSELSEDIGLLPALNVLDVRNILCLLMGTPLGNGYQKNNSHKVRFCVLSTRMLVWEFCKPLRGCRFEDKDSLSLCQQHTLLLLGSQRVLCGCSMTNASKSGMHFLFWKVM